MTGGQMAPQPGGASHYFTLRPSGEHCGYPVRISELLATLQGAAYVTRVSVHDVPNIRKAKRAILKALKFSKGLGFSIVEVISTCPTNWGMTPLEA